MPLLAAIGTASLVTDYLEGAFSRWLEAKLMEMYLEVRSWLERVHTYTGLS